MDCKQGLLFISALLMAAYCYPQKKNQQFQDETTDKIIPSSKEWKATWNNQIIARSKNTIIVEGNTYFPPESVQMEYLKSTDYHTTCKWKGVASYYSLIVDDKENENAAWYYPEPKPEATIIKHYVAFYKGISVEEEN